jgi:protein-L-isoaspartate(D-aspartate) O-methyltransferase
LERLQCRNVEVHVSNGSLGWPAGAPYNGIIVTAAAPAVPPALVQQLADGGRLVLPVGSRTAQDLLLVTRRGDSTETRNLGPVRFVPLLGEAGWEPESDSEPPATT